MFFVVGHLFCVVLRIRKYVFRIRILGSVILNYGSGSQKAINFGSGFYLVIFVATSTRGTD
jgi:hypothetical protein